MGAGCSDAPGLFFLKSSSLLIFLSIERSAGQVSSLAYKLTKNQQLLKTSTHKYAHPNSQTPQPKSSSTQRTINFKTYQLTNSPTLQLPQLKKSLTQKLINLKTSQLKKSPTQKLTNSKTPQNSQTLQLKTSSTQNTINPKEPQL